MSVSYPLPHLHLAWRYSGYKCNIGRRTSLTGFVTVSVYVPAALTVGVAVVAPDTIFPPPLATHAKVAPGVVEAPSRAMDVVVHVSTLSAPAFTFGGALFRVTSATSVAVHPLTGFVTVSVYVPAH